MVRYAFATSLVAPCVPAGASMICDRLLVLALAWYFVTTSRWIRPHCSRYGFVCAPRCGAARATRARTDSAWRKPLHPQLGVARLARLVLHDSCHLALLARRLPERCATCAVTN
ncbi:hypothetical protein BKA62DRAFT_691391 [Auriculariales sp. MPI-PUGE-AT-0066]|nr:hypothetical protein BKA62DRAFT_691391 [Auriculariales sp. MPI-PUGE-AT-0066]